MKIEKMLEKKVWKQNKIEKEDVVLAAVSGGADSVCLLFLLQELQKEKKFQLEVIHVEHGIRGEESRQDAEFVKKLCERLQIPMHFEAVDVPAFAKQEGIGTEEAARRLRYDAFRKIARERKNKTGCVKIALAHHADDNAETVLFQMIRGSGLEGLSGMKTERELEKNIWLIRPLLGISRKEIEAYLEEKGQTFCKDATNQDTKYSRNKLRWEVMPRLKELNSEAAAHINQSAGLVGEAAEYLRQQAQKIFSGNCRMEEAGLQIKKELWKTEPVFLQKKALQMALAEATGSERDLTNQHIEALWELGEKQVGRHLDLPRGIKAVRNYEGIFLNKAVAETTIKKQKTAENVTLTREELRKIEGGEQVIRFVEGGCFCFRIFQFRGNTEQISQKPYTKWLNYDRITHELQIRKRRQGDYLTIDEAGHRKKLKDYFVQEKVPQEKREDIWLLTDEDHVVWVIGKRISSHYKVSMDTEKVLEVQFLEEMQ